MDYDTEYDVSDQDNLNIIKKFSPLHNPRQSQKQHARNSKSLSDDGVDPKIHEYDEFPEMIFHGYSQCNKTIICLGQVNFEIV